MQFGHIEYFYALWAVVALALFLIWSMRRKRALLARFATNELLARLMSHVSLVRQNVKMVLLVLAALLLVLALTEPKWGFQWEKIERRGIDVIVAVDVSRSMLATDVKPTRLERAKRNILDLLQILDGDRIGLIAFRGAAHELCPLTLDYGAVKMFVDDLSPELTAAGSTDLGAPIRKAIALFDQSSKNSRALILITDGQDFSGDASAAAELAKKHNVRIFCVGIGTPEGAPVQLIDERGNTTYVKDASGNVQLAKLDEETLKRIAFITGGAYVATTGAGLELDVIYRERIAKMEDRLLESTRRKRYEHRFQWPLAAAAFLLILEAVLDDRTRVARASTKGGGA